MDNWKWDVFVRWLCVSIRKVMWIMWDMELWAARKVETFFFQMKWNWLQVIDWLFVAIEWMILLMN
jgi:hypothetical protein